ncbi:MAG: recombinase RecT [Candidatus Gastranaerophilales bacterium]|nr:recombinase RecT [Candidatus Gastranaerophilales bacterium]
MSSQTQVAALKQKAQENRQKAKPIQVLIQQSITELGKAVPSHMNPERMVRIALTTLRLNPKLMDCTPESFLGALFQSAQLGLEPNIEGQAYIIPYENSKKVGNNWTKITEAQFQIGYKGYVELFYRHEKALSLDMQAVRVNDTFEYEYGTNAYIKHIPKLKDRGEVIAYYAVAKLKEGGTLFKVMSKDECIEHGKTHSKCWITKVYDETTKKMEKVKEPYFAEYSPWHKDPDAMCLKTVLIQLMKLLPKSVEIQHALKMDATTKSKIDLDMINIPDETNWQDDAIEAEQVKQIANKEQEAS